ncbi:50S ribosomal protein L17 [Candidatus Uhrbacteria bacterium CG10_big_fil_rev_8_21_14_0_10_48_11]|uniref:50S ribosomal protein L17 n=1 Tax=Candidatus Uhrbacteria bacterium CG10_big_fil_rev_8_21_14_0_10_48_11 TaxID=1975037 RepID=A0A2M8LEF6_9BACT|nr:MAG: 50S ribosomal protein L17 [Candidatus Uhrbacteria bacterium CG10_big_fil_rev_8_21_14_0_10_48_11]
MRHRQKTKTLDRKKAPRELMLRNLVSSIILYEKVTTTLAKAKAVRGMVDTVITIAKKNDVTARRRLLQTLPVKNAVTKALEDLGPRYAKRDSGYTRITKTGSRQGDGASTATIELV